MSKVNYKMQIQLILKDVGLYDDIIDGIMGPKTLKGISAFLETGGINTSGWDNKRKVAAMEQIFYNNAGLGQLVIDGLVGPVTLHAREAYEASLVPVWRDEAEKIEETNKKIQPPAPSVSPSKWPWQSGVSSFFGGVGENQTKLTLPFPMVLAWDPGKKVHSYSCHTKVKPHMERIWNRTLEHYGYEKIKELRIHYFGGCLNIRKMRGGSSWSIHSWGAAVDLDPDNNQLKWSSPKAKFSKKEYEQFWKIVEAEGWTSLGRKRNFDWMHFQAAYL